MSSNLIKTILILNAWTAAARAAAVAARAMKKGEHMKAHRLHLRLGKKLVSKGDSKTAKKHFEASDAHYSAGRKTYMDGSVDPGFSKMARKKSKKLSSQD